MRCFRQRRASCYLLALSFCIVSCGGQVADPSTGDESSPPDPTEEPSGTPGAGGSTGSLGDLGRGSTSTGGAASSTGDPGDSVEAITYDGTREHPGCRTPPCCLGGSPDTNIELASKCKYITKALVICGCYDPAIVDAVMRRCVSAYRRQGDVCSGLNCTSIESCSSAGLYLDGLIDLGMPPVLPTCDRSQTWIMSQVYEGSC